MRLVPVARTHFGVVVFRDGFHVTLLDFYLSDVNVVESADRTAQRRFVVVAAETFREDDPDGDTCEFFFRGNLIHF